MSRVVINIGAAFAGSFKTVVGGAKRQLQTLGSSLRELKARESALGRFATGQTRLQQTRQQYRQQYRQQTRKRTRSQHRKQTLKQYTFVYKLH